MNAAEKLGQNVSIKQACAALGVSRATLYRQRRRKEEKNESRERSQRSNPAGRALNPGQRAEVRVTL